MRSVLIPVAVLTLAAACRPAEQAAESAEQPPAPEALVDSAAVPDSPTTGETETAMEPPTPQPTDSIVEGTVTSVNAAPFEQLVLASDDGRVAIVGDLRRELQRLEGVTVRAWGPATDNRPPMPQRAVAVTGYEIVSVRGAVPLVGSLEQHGDGWYVVGGDTTKLAMVPDRLAAAAGARIWVLGTMQESEYHVDAYGVISEVP
jgi:hypothetical protein